MSKKEETKIEEVVDVPKIPVEELVKEPYTLRELTDEDIYPVCEIIGKVLPDDMKEAFVQIMSGEKSLKDTGIMVAFDLGKMILKNFSRVKTEMYEFLSGMSGIPVEELKKMPFGTTPRMIKDVFKDAKNTDFFKELSEFLS
jgi:hypothetical protein